MESPQPHSNFSELIPNRMAAVGAPLADLFRDYKADIDELLNKISTYLEEKNDEGLHRAARDMPLDEFTCLKFVLSAQRKKEKAKEVAYERLVETLTFRDKYRKSMERARENPEIESIIEMTCGGFLGDEFVLVNHYGRADFASVKKKFESVDAIFGEAVVASEQMRLILDRRSRETGRLCKVLSVVNLEGLSYSIGSNVTVMRALGQLSRSNEVNYPQMLSRAVILHAGATFRMLMGLMKPFLSKNTLDKLVVCGVRGHNKDDCSSCPFVKKYVNGIDEIPKDVGGKREVTKVWNPSS